MGAKIFNLSFPAELLAAIEDAAKLLYETRSEYIRHAVVRRLKEEGFGVPLRPKTREDVQRDTLKNFLAAYSEGDFTDDVDE